MYKNARVLVTGGAGFIGINLVRELAALGASVTVIDIKDPPVNASPAGVKFIKQDFTKTEEYQDVLDESEYCFHLAARTDLSGENIRDYSTNYEGAEKLLDALKNNIKIKRFTFTSTQLVVGIFNERKFLDETEPYKTRTLYGQSKILGEMAVIENCQKNSIPYTIVRPTSVYGPYGKEPYRDFFLTIKDNRYFHIGRAQNLISMAFVKNVVDQILFLSTHAKAIGEIFFTSDLYPYTMKQFSDEAALYWGTHLHSMPDFLVYPAAYALGILKLIGFQVPLYPFRLKNIKAYYCYSLQKSLELGYLPKFGLQQGMRETLDWYTKNDESFVRGKNK